MKLRGITLTMVACVTFATVGPAHAAGPTVEALIAPRFTHWLQEGSDTVLAGGVCRARGVGASPTQVAVATRIRCSVNGTERSASSPGPVAQATILVAAVPPVLMCWSGSAIFMETVDGSDELVSVEVPEACIIQPV